MIKKLISLEDELIIDYFKAEYLENQCFENESDSNLDPNSLICSIAHKVHEQLLKDLFFTFVSQKFPQNAVEILIRCFDTKQECCKNITLTTAENIPHLCEKLHISFLNSKFRWNGNPLKIRTKSKEQLIELGAVYTQSHIAKKIVNETISNIGTPLDSSKILDFACGTGRFYENILSLFENPQSAALTNVFAVDIDINAIRITRLKALSNFDSITIEECNKICKHIICKDALKLNTSLLSEDSYLSNDDFDGLINSGFDAIVSNPPYLVLKPNKSKGGLSTADKIQEQVQYFRNSGVYSFSIEGMLNLYQLSIERMLQMLKNQGALGVICPSTLFGDISASKLRKHLILENRVISIDFYAERIPLFENVNQATNIFILQKGCQTQNIRITEQEETFDVNLSLIKELFPNNLEIPAIKSLEWDILRKLSTFKKLKDFPFIRNRRGELDLSLYKNFITTEKTNYRLIRGNMIGDNCINDINGEYVENTFISTRSKDFCCYDLNKQRLICQQISNRGLKKRLKFVYCQCDDIIGNSCNYISSDSETLNKLFLLLNSAILNWRFNITSSNNHINNYELAELPIIDLSLIETNKQFSSDIERECYIGNLYGLTESEIKFILQ